VSDLRYGGETGGPVILDTGPLVAVLDVRDQWHGPCVDVWPDVIARCVTTEAVVTEACHLVMRGGAPATAPLDFLLRAGIPILSLPAGGHTRASEIMRRFSTLPADYADASLVALAEATHANTVFTTDRRGFSAYRLPRGRRFALLPPPLAR
jgi:hypothetical protein